MSQERVLVWSFRLFSSYSKTKKKKKKILGVGQNVKFYLRSESEISPARNESENLSTCSLSFFLFFPELFLGIPLQTPALSWVLTGAGSRTNSCHPSELEFIESNH